MSDQPDPNLDDEGLIQSIAENAEGIARGQSCAMCEAEWVDHRMTHKHGCLYVVVVDLLEDRDVIESYLDAS